MSHLHHVAEEDEALLFQEEEEESVISVEVQPWKILVVDDDEEVHALTKLVLRDLVFQSRPMQLFFASSAAEAKQVLAGQSDISLLLLDVVMESEDAGLQLVHHVRRELGNQAVRIILRTGQPGQAPEQKVVMEFDINDYKEKTELTSQKLVTAVISSLRSYGYIQQVVALNRELEERVKARTQALELANSKLHNTLKALQEGEEAGKRIQFKLLPPNPQEFDGIRLQHLLLPSEYMSGDFADYIALDKRYLMFYMADVSGHGVSSAFVTVYLKRFINTLVSQYGMGEVDILDPAYVLRQLNSALMEDDLGKHIAIFLGVFDRQKWQLKYCNGGIFPWPLLISEGESQFLEMKGTPTGLFDFAEYESALLNLPTDFQLILFSDGVMEVMQEDSLDNKLKVLKQTVLPHVTDLRALTTTLGRQDERHLPDDMTLLMMEGRKR
ncbi:SpoIIE family protein phosphatase [Aliiglaciecola sp. CAU 1673]|uniref:PP2C family protein-serine/threonine phosphatase n=1 Tax=Aliiglaciecola sp. CAU 1673 TaxID=3032595 RepID=UPI0023DAFCED|nr:SpoIIE family protein phosphatase [Aliiglaciecola sp. CAU 1673]MDF2179723.1 SpoIIE family protein phosphatase [Aliiglaciecola sp. CAU 1673]